MKIIFPILFFILFFLKQTIHAQNASLIKDITPGTASSFNNSNDTIVGYVGDLLLFVLQDQSNISRLYATDGTAANTLVLHSSNANEQFINFVKTDSATMTYVVYDQQLLTYKLYKTNGIDTTQLNAHSITSSINNLHFFQNHLYYNDIQYLRRIDLANTLDELVYQASDTIVDFYISADTIYYAAKTTEKDSLYTYITTSQTKTSLSTIGYSTNTGLNFTKVSNKLILFSNQMNRDSTFCYGTDGSIGGTQLLLMAYSAGHLFRQVCHGQMYFDVLNYLGISNGTRSGTTELSYRTYIESGIVYNGEIYYVAIGDGNVYTGDLLYDKDGPLGGYQDWGGDVYYPNAETKGIITVNGKLYMSGTYTALFENDQYGVEIIEVKTDSNLSVNERYTMYETVPGPSTYYSHYLCNTATKIFFIGHDAATGMELYVFTPQSPTVLSITEEQSNPALFKCYPNPSSGQVNLVYNGIDEITSIQLKDISGKQVLEFSSFNTLDIHDVEQGVYFLNIQLKNSTQVIKIIRQ